MSASGNAAKIPFDLVSNPMKVGSILPEFFASIV
jgi:hypothetical protein